ncbi:MAG: DUF6273 domain-containing protein, partial [Eubacterium sp.]|nr:DUF6273 domain-containing protein [Eubacterium sp.]
MAKLKIKIGKTEFMADGNPEHIEKELSAFTEMVRSTPAIMNVTNCLPETGLKKADKGCEIAQAGKGAKVVRHKSEQVAWENLPDNMQLYDELECDLSNGNRATFVLIKESDGYLTFCSKDCMTRHCMNDNASIKSGIAASEMQEYLDTEVWNLLPDELKDIIAVTRRKYKDGDQTKEFDAKLFLLSASEVFEKDECCGEEELYSQIDYFKDERNRVKCKDRETAYWWLSSPDAGYSTAFCIVLTSGGANVVYASNANGVVPCFCIKKS